MENIIKTVKDYLDKMTPDEIDAMLVELGNNSATPGPLFMSRGDFKKKSIKNDKYNVVDVKCNININGLPQWLSPTGSIKNNINKELSRFGSPNNAYEMIS
jgi:hypothetical protein